MSKYDDEPKISDLTKVNKTSNQTKKPYKNTDKRTIETCYYAQAKEDNSEYYKFITNLFDPPKMDEIDIRINDMEKSLYAMIDEEDSELAPPS